MTVTVEVASTHGLTPVTVYKNVYSPSTVNPLAVTEAELPVGLIDAVAVVGWLFTVHLPTVVPEPVNDALVAEVIVCVVPAFAIVGEAHTGADFVIYTVSTAAEQDPAPLTVYLNEYLPFTVNPFAVTLAAFAIGANVTVAPAGTVTVLHVPTAEPVPAKATVVPVID